MLRALRWRRDLRAMPIILVLGCAPTCEQALADPPRDANRAMATERPRRFAEDFKAEAGDRVFFASGSASLGARARVALEAQAAWLLRHTEVDVTVEGYADDPGDEGANLALATARAETVRDKLAQLGVPEARLAIMPYGRAGQVVTCPDPACAAPNRRVVLRIAGPEAAADPRPHAGRPGIRPALRRLF